KVIGGGLWVHIDSVLSKSGGRLEARAVAGEQVLSDNHCVGADAVEKSGAARALETLTEHVQARHRRDAVVVGKLAVHECAGDMQPGIAAPVAGGPDHRRHSAVSEVEPRQWVDRRNGDELVP